MLCIDIKTNTNETNSSSNHRLGDGLGKGIANRLAKNGFSVVLNDINEKTLKQTESEFKKEAGIILSAAQTMIAGNMYGIPFSAFLSRLHGKPYKGSSLFYELGMQIAGLLCLPIAIVHGLLRGLVGLPHERFDKSKTIE